MPFIHDRRVVPLVCVSGAKEEDEEQQQEGSHNEPEEVERRVLAQDVVVSVRANKGEMVKASFGDHRFACAECGDAVARRCLVMNKSGLSG